jgi:hypothetical protein
MKNYITLALNTDSRKAAIRSALRGCEGKFFTVTFIKKDKSIRVLTGRLGVKKHLKGGVSTTSHLDKYLCVYEPKSKSYKNVNLETVLELNALGNRLKFVEVA